MAPEMRERTVAVVDSNESFANSFASLLKAYGFEAIIVSKDQIEEYAENNPVDIVTTDLRDDDRDDHNIAGVTLARRLSKPVLILSAASSVPEGIELPDNAIFLGKDETPAAWIKTIEEMSGQTQK